MLSAVDEVKKLFQTLGFDSNKKLNGVKGADEHVRHLYATKNVFLCFCFKLLTRHGESIQARKRCEIN